MASLLYYPWWEFRIIHRFNRSDFQPKPNVDTVLLHIKPRPHQLLPFARKFAYYDFIAFNFKYHPQAKFISASHWLTKFKHNRQNVTGIYAKLLHEQNHLQKIHRTRTDPNWKKFS
jgi:16S rRNA A1518/A1519 N6-dimethyltransferase RsmA/KsgA/DIM1 with predicted DNA glycosylase/AP lyase activity